MLARVERKDNYCETDRGNKSLYDLCGKQDRDFSKTENRNIT